MNSQASSLGDRVAEPIVSDLVKKFINDHVGSVVELEILLLLHTDPKHIWTPHDLARELRIESAGAQQQLELLRASGLVTTRDPGTYAYAPQPELHEAVVALAQAYLVKRVTVIGLIFAKPPDSLRAFSDAFRLRKDSPK